MPPNSYAVDRDRIERVARQKYGVSFADRFFRRVPLAGDGECWEWKGAKTRGGYGVLMFRGRRAYAHRVAYEIFQGTSPQALSILHSCDNPRCVNPNHLRLGTQAENFREMVTKRRHAYGSRSGHAKIDEGDVIEIRKLARNGASFPQLAEIYPLDPRTLAQVASGERWAHVQGTTHVRAPNVKGENNGHAKLTVGAVLEIRRLRAGGVPCKVLCQKYGVSHATLCSAANGRTWRHVHAD